MEIPGSSITRLPMRVRPIICQFFREVSSSYNPNFFLCYFDFIGLLLKTENNTIIFQPNFERPANPLKPLLKLDFHNNSRGFSLEKIGENAPNDGFWFAVRDYKANSGFPLEVGDQFKLGRAVFKVLELQRLPLRPEPQKTKGTRLSLNESFFSLKEQFSTRHMSPQSHRYDTLQDSQRLCRICLEPEVLSEQTENPLLAPCRCSGSVRYVHWKCLAQWLTGRTQRDEYAVTLLWKKFKCELCGFRFGSYNLMIRDNK